MRKFILCLYTLVIIDPYKGLKYDQVNAYYYFNDTSDKDSSNNGLYESDQSVKSSRSESSYFDDEDEDDDCEYCLSEDELSSIYL